MLFQDRFETGRVLASKLRHLANRSDVVILALLRGGVLVNELLNEDDLELSSWNHTKLYRFAPFVRTQR
jgi:hypothetical protein